MSLYILGSNPTNVNFACHPFRNGDKKQRNKTETPQMVVTWWNSRNVGLDSLQYFRWLFVFWVQIHPQPTKVVDLACHLVQYDTIWYHKRFQWSPPPVESTQMRPPVSRDHLPSFLHASLRGLPNNGFCLPSRLKDKNTRKIILLIKAHSSILDDVFKRETVSTYSFT